MTTINKRMAGAFLAIMTASSLSACGTTRSTGNYTPGSDVIAVPYPGLSSVPGSQEKAAANRLDATKVQQLAELDQYCYMEIKDKGPKEYEVIAATSADYTLFGGAGGLLGLAIDGVTDPGKMVAYLLGANGGAGAGGGRQIFKIGRKTAQGDCMKQMVNFAQQIDAQLPGVAIITVPMPGKTKGFSTYNGQPAPKADDHSGH